MNALLELLLSNALAATMLAVLVAGACVVIRRPAVRNALWLVVLVRLFLPPVWSVPVLEVQQVPSTEYRAHADPIGKATDNTEPRTDVVHAVDEVLVPEEVVRAADALPSAIDASPPSSVDAMPSPAVLTLIDDTIPSALSTPYFVLGVWLAGVLLIVVLAAIRVRRFQRALRRDAVRASAEFQGQAAEVARRLGLRQSPEVWLVPGRVPPLLWMPGLRRCRARIVLPAALVLRLNVDERSALLAHELAHLRRGDPWVRWLELFAQALYWWHPLLCWFRRRLRESEEQCCDAWVVATLPARRAYATALVETVAFLNDGPALQAQPLASGAAPVRQLQRRVGMIMRGTSSGRLTRAGLLAALGFAACALAIGPELTQAQDRERPTEEKRVPEEKKDRDRPPAEKKDRPFPPRGERPDGERPPVNREDIERAREMLAKAREEAEKAMQRVREAEERLARMTGGRVPPREGGGLGGGRPVERRPELPPVGRGEGGLGRGEDRPPFGRGEGGMPDLARQIQELRQMVEELRRELRGRGPEDRPTAPRPDRSAPRPDDRRDPNDRRRDTAPPAERPAPDRTPPAPERPTEPRRP